MLRFLAVLLLPVAELFAAPGTSVFAAPSATTAFVTTQMQSGTISSVSVGTGHACAVKTDGGLLCWGAFGKGQASPQKDRFKVVSASTWGDHTCGIKTDGSLLCWGGDIGGVDPLGRPPDGTFTAVSVAEGSACAVKTDGTIVCWGYDENQVSP